MREFFRGWKRKAGCLTLLLACMFAGAWVRSQTISDRLTFILGTRPYDVTSISDGVVIYQSLEWLPPPSQRQLISWRSIENNSTPVPLGHMYADDSLFYFPSSYTIVPHHCFVIPLTLLSAWLLLSKPRAKSNRTDRTIDLRVIRS